MKLELRSRGVPMTEGLRAHAERRLRFALGRFGDRVRSIRVRIADVNGPRGGEDIECLVQASLAPRGTLRVTETHRDPFRAVARVSERIGHHVARHFERRRARQKGR